MFPRRNVMKAHLARTAIGLLAFDDNQRIIAHSFFSRDPLKAVSEYEKGIGNDFLEKLSGYDASEDDAGKRIARKMERKIAIEKGFVKSSPEFNEFVAGFGMALSSRKLKGSITMDLVLVQSSNALESLNKFVNILTEHFKEWFWLNYPEYKEENEKILHAVVEYGARDNFPGFSESYGISLGEADIESLREMAIQLERLYAERKKLDSYVRSLAKEVAPNMACLVDELLAARIISIGGSLENLSKMPAGTLQLLGAEKALFRHLKNRNAKPPKFGVLYECSYVRNAPAEKKGKVARIVASQLSKAAKIDFYSKRDDGKKMKEEMEKEIEDVMKK